MESFSVIQILKTFTKEEVKEFDKFTGNSYFGGSEYIAKFWRAIRPFYPEFKRDDIQKEKLFKELYPGKAFNDATIRKLSSELLKVCEEFIKVVELKKTKIGERFLARRFRNSQLLKQYESKWNEIVEYYEGESNFDFINLIERHLLQIPQIQFKADKKDINGIFSERMKYYEYILVYNLVILMQEKTRRYISNEVYDVKKKNIAEEFFTMVDIELFIEKYTKEYSEFNDLILFNYHIMMAFGAPESIEHFYSAKKIIFRNSSIIPPKPLFLYCTMLINYCLKMKGMNMKSIPEYYNEAVEVFSMMQKKNIIIEPGTNFISPSLFTVAMLAYCTVKDFKGAERFVKKFSSSLTADSREALEKQAKYYIYFYSGEFEKALDILIKLEQVNYFDRINYRREKLIIFYELKMYEQMSSLIHSLQQFVAENKMLSPNVKNNTKLFLKFSKMLLKAVESRKTKDIEELTFSLSKEKKYFEHKSWLEEKVSEL